ncbi:MAG: molybdenum cofactor guanylyltransferase [Thermomicrobiales bacterium]|nr:molybdenum cofactor guanylyltransferase [Thermomicrobiales bacterium]
MRIAQNPSIAVLAGGRSSRFGSDKAMLRLETGGPPLIQIVVDTVRLLSRDVFIVGHSRYARLVPDVPVVPDETPDSGPLAAIGSALRASAHPRTLVVACDMPCLSIPLLRRMTAIQTDADVIVPQTTDGRFHPLHAIYRTSALAQVDAALSQGQRAVTAMLRHVHLEIVSETDLRAVDPNLDSLFSINRPDDVMRAKRCLNSSLLTRIDA